MTFEVRQGDCVELMAAMPAGSVDAVVCDPPYGIGFMGKAWDGAAIAEKVARDEATRRTTGPPADSRDGRSKGRSKSAFGNAGGYAGTYDHRQGDNNKTSARGGAMHAGKYDLSLSANQSYQRWCEEWARECLRVLKPGGHLLASCGTRTYHRMTSGIEDAGFEIRDTICWLYGSGFPKSLDVGKAIDKRPGVASHREFVAHLVERREVAALSRADVSEKVVGTRSGACWNWEHHQFPEARWWPALRDLLGLDDERWGPVIAEAERQKTGERDGNLLAVAPGQENDRSATLLDVTAPATPEAERWEGWGTALKPAHEPVVVARKPLSGTVAANCLEHGTGALNIDGCRVGGEEITVKGYRAETGQSWEATGMLAANVDREPTRHSGRWPANVVLDGEAAGLLDEQTGELQGATSRTASDAPNAVYGAGVAGNNLTIYGDSGGASRFFPTFDNNHEEAECAGSGGSSITSQGDTPSKPSDAGTAPNAAPPAGPSTGRPEPTGTERFRYVAKASRAERGAGLGDVGCSCETFTEWVNEDPSPSTPPASATPPVRATTAPTSTDDSRWSTDGSGSRPTDPSPPVSRSTTETATSRTTPSATSSSSTTSPTSGSTPPTTAEQATTGSDAAPYAASGSPPPPSTTTSADKAGSSTADADRATSRSLSEPSRSAGKPCPDCGGVVQGALRNSHPT